MAGFLHVADLHPEDCVDPAAVGGAVTTALCGHWEHQGACRWPHHSTNDAVSSIWCIRTVFVAPVAEEADVRARIDRALANDERWRVLSSGAAPLVGSDRALADRLATPSTT